MMRLIPLSKTSVDWANYLKIVNDTIGRSPTAALDAQWIKPTHTLATYLATLKEINNDGVSLEHIHCGFMLVAPKQTTYSIIIKTRLSITTVESSHQDFHLTILSGNLSQWRTAILNCCVENVSKDIRDFGNLALNFFDEENLQEFMSGLVKVNMGDGTVRLIDKK